MILECGKVWILSETDYYVFFFLKILRQHSIIWEWSGKCKQNAGLEIKNGWKSMGEGIEGHKEWSPGNSRKLSCSLRGYSGQQNQEEPEEPRSQRRWRANKPIVRASDNWIKAIIEFLGSKIENLVSLDSSQRGITTFLEFYKGNNSKLNWPNFSLTI